MERSEAGILTGAAWGVGMQAMIHAGSLGVALDGVTTAIGAPSSGPVAAAAAESVLFESVIRRRRSDGAVLALIALLCAAGLATGFWMAVEVAEGIAIAERCGGDCAQTAR